MFFLAIFSLILWHQLSACVASQSYSKPALEHQQQMPVEIMEIQGNLEQDDDLAWFEDEYWS